MKALVINLILVFFISLPVLAAPPGGGPAVLNCSTESYKDKVVINEVFHASEEFIELYFLESVTIPNNDQWQLCYVKNNNQDVCVDWPADNQVYDADTYAFYDLPNSAGINTTEAEVVLLDGNGDVIDAWRYCNESSCAEIEWSIPAACLSVITNHASNEKDLARRPDGTGEPQDNGSGHTKGGSNDEGSGGGTDPDPVVASGFNCVHSSDGGAANGRLYTRVAGAAFSIDVVALNVSGAIETAYASDANRNVTVELVDASGGQVCASQPALGPAVSQTVTFTAGDAGRKTSANFLVSKAWRSVGCRVTDATATPVVGCSSDSFAIRPDSISLNIPVLNNAGSTGDPKAKTGEAFTLEATTVSGYDGTPVIVGSLDAHSGGIAGTLSGIFSVADINTGTATGTGFSYSEVGNFRFQENAIHDTGFTAVDQAGDCVDNSYSNTLSGGKVGCDFSNSAVSGWVGRFIPDHFIVSIDDHGALADACSGFSYSGTDIPFSTDPLVTISALNNGGAVTANYKGDYAKLVIGDINMPAISGDGTTNGVDGVTPVTMVWNAGTPSLVSNNDGTFIFTLSGDTFTYGRGDNELVAPFVADVDLEINAITDSDSVLATDLPQTITPTGTEVRYGRLNLLHAYGSELQTLAMTMLVEYYNGAGSGFVPNTMDTCTVINNVVITDGDPTDSLQVNETCIWDSFGNSGSYNCASAGVAVDQYSQTPVASNFNLNLMGPGEGNTGVLNVTAGSPAYLDFDWLGGGMTDPTGTATFGIHNTNNRMIFMKEVR